MIDWENLNFIPEEMECRCGCGVLGIDPEFMTVLQEIRTLYGRVMNVSSGYRCAAHPAERKKVDRGGKPGSHYTGCAADIRCAGSDALMLLRVALMHEKITGVGVKQTGPHDHRFIHLDTVTTPPRPNIWSY